MMRCKGQWTLVAVLALLWLPAPAGAAGSAGATTPAYEWRDANVNLDDRGALHRGARVFVNYCMGCHSAELHRWSHVANDLGIPPDVVQRNLIWTTDEHGAKDQVGALMEIAMTESYGETVFGQQPPDLSLVTRYRGPDWVFNFLRGFYLSEASPVGVDNVMLSGSTMPHVLWPMQGFMQPVHENDDPDGDIVAFEQAMAGSMSSAEFDRTLNDVVTFLVYVGEPAILKRTTIGLWVMLFLILFTFLAWLLKREYWADVH